MSIKRNLHGDEGGVQWLLLAGLFEPVDLIVDFLEQEKSKNSPSCPSHLQPPRQTNPALRQRESSSPPGDAHRHDLNVGYLAEKHQLVDGEGFTADEPSGPHAYPLTKGVVADISTRRDVGGYLGKERRCCGLGPEEHGT